MSKYDDLAKLKELFDDGVLTREEYDAERKKILDRPDDAAQQYAAQGSQPFAANNFCANPPPAAPTVMPKPKNKWVALLLCFFLGFLGAHKFYEGKTVLGLVYIFTGGIFAVGVIVDFIKLILKPNPYFV